MSHGFSRFTDEEALRTSEALLVHAGPLAEPPPGASEGARRNAASFPAIVDEVRGAHAALDSAAAAVTTLGVDYELAIAAARRKEKALDAGFVAIRTQLAVEIKGGSAEAEAMDGSLFPNGSQELTRLQGRSQVIGYKGWLPRLASAAVASNPAYAAIAPLIERFRALLAELEADIEAKEALLARLTAATAARKPARAAWEGACGEMIEAAARIHGEDSPTFSAWIQPLREAKALRAAARTRRAPQAGEDEATTTETTTTEAPTTAVPATATTEAPTTAEGSK